MLGNKDRLVAASSPTGPAFEGAEISGGQRAAPGAIERVRIDPETLEPKVKVIGGEHWSDEPGFAESAAAVGVTGICGSGIIEAIAEMFLAGIISEDGVIDGSLAAKTRPHRRRPAAPSPMCSARRQERQMPEIRILQTDVRAIQLAKAALYAGARLLMDKLGIDQVDRIKLAGAFGTYIDPKYAMVIGLVPDCPLDKVAGVGNAAGTGARMALLNKGYRREIEDAGAADREDRDGDRAAIPGAFRQRHGASRTRSSRSRISPRAVPLPKRREGLTAGAQETRRRRGRAAQRT